MKHGARSAHARPAEREFANHRKLSIAKRIR